MNIIANKNSSRIVPPAAVAVPGGFGVPRTHPLVADPLVADPPPSSRPPRIRHPSGSRHSPGSRTPLGADPPPGCGPGDPPGQIPLNFPLGCGPGDPPWSDPPQLPPLVWAWRCPPKPDAPKLPPWVWARKPARHARIPSPGDLLQGMLGYHLQCMLGMLGYHPPPPPREQNHRCL